MIRTILLLTPSGGSPGNASGTAPAVSLSALAATAMGAAAGAAAAAAVSISALSGIATGSAAASGSAPSISLSAPSGSASGGGSGNASGAASAVSVGSPSGVATGDGSASGSPPSISLSAPSGTASGGSSAGNASGVAPAISLRSPAGHATGGGTPPTPGVLAPVWGVGLQRSLPGLPSRYRSPAFRAIETVLKEDPVLANFVRTWRSREGVPGESALPVSADQLPMIALSPIPNPSSVLGEDETRINFAVAVEMAVLGSCVEDLFALWEAVEDAIVDAKPMRGSTVQRFLCGVISPPINGPAGVMRLRPSAPAFQQVSVLRGRPEDAQITISGGVGTLTCFIRRPA